MVCSCGKQRHHALKALRGRGLSAVGCTRGCGNPQVFFHRQAGEQAPVFGHKTQARTGASVRRPGLDGLVLPGDAALRPGANADQALQQVDLPAPFKP
jgi:hypothetical protein